MLNKDVIRCHICNQKMEYLDSEKIKLQIIKEGSPIGNQTYRTAVNVLFYCNQCKANVSKPYCYDEEKFVEIFIADIKKASAKFETRSYMQI